MSRPYHHGDLREEVLRRAMVKIEELGWDALSLRDLARESGVSPSAPQRHFPTKQDLLDALAVRGYDELRNVLSANDVNGPIEKTLANFAQAYVSYAIDHPVLVELMYRTRSGQVAAASVRAFAQVDVLLDRASTRGELIGDVHVVNTFVRVVIRGLATTYVSRVVPSDDRTTVPQMIQAMLSGLRAR